MKPIEESPLYRRVRLHGRRRLGKDKYIKPEDYMEDLQEFLRLEREMLLRYHEKGGSGLEGVPGLRGNDRCAADLPFRQRGNGLAR